VKNSFVKWESRHHSASLPDLLIYQASFGIMTTLAEILEYFDDTTTADGDDDLRHVAMVALKSKENAKKWANLSEALEDATRIGRLIGWLSKGG